ncbi:MAG: glycosyltransferase, partial [Betaproteobacteria bacterium]
MSTSARPTRIKLLCNWATPQELCNEWDRMSQGERRWNDIEVTWEDVDVDLYVIVNHPRPGDHYVPERTIIFQMEPWCPEPYQTWGVRNWGEWSQPDAARFLQVRAHRRYLNNAFWQLRATYSELRTQPIHKTKVLSTICSGKYFDPGHRKRVDFLRYLDSKNDDVVRVELYAYENPLGFRSWVGPHPPGVKDAALMPYRYFFSAENNREHNFITEKLWEPLLAESLCFYWGAPNAAEHVDSRAFIALDLDDFEQSFQTMKAAIAGGEWEKRVAIIRQQKQRVLEHFQFFPTLERILNDDFRLPLHFDADTLRYHKYFGDALGQTLRRVCFIHSFTRKRDATILAELLSSIAGSDLLDTLDRIYVINVGDDAVIDMTAGGFGSRLRLIEYSRDASRHEAPTLELIRTFALFHPDAAILYLHTKGASYENRHAHVDDWRRLLVHFLVEHHRRAFDLLASNDAVGCNLLDRPRRHFSGNFWWANARYLNTLPPPGNADRHDAEWWLLGANPARAASLHDSGTDHYRAPYPRLRYSQDASPPTGAHLCLCMIVKDEAHVVTETLVTIAPHIDYWVIVDTGSSDATMDVIRAFFAALNIPGELHQRPWYGFDVNRSEALALARGKADYLWMIDADDLVVGAPDLSNLTLDSYNLRYGADFRYWRKQIFRGTQAWRYEGAIHEYPVCADSGATEGRLEGIYHIESRRLGSRSLVADKYQRDVRILLAALERNPEDARAVFYLAQSYRDAGDPRLALENYERRAAMGGWNEELFYALLQCGALREQLGEPWEKALSAYLRCWECRPSRAEPLYHIARRCRIDGQYNLGYLFAGRATAIPFPEHDNLFVATDVYEWKAADELAICAYYLGRHRESFDLCTRLLDVRAIPEPDHERIIANRDFAAPHISDETLRYPEETIARLVAAMAAPSREPAQVTLTITSCRRPELFEKTVNSFLNCCADLERIDRWICIDDGTDAATLERLVQRYPFFEFICKTRANKGHARSMNILLETIATPYWLHLEDDWHFIVRDRYVEKMLAVLSEDSALGQVLFNRNYGETLECRAIPGGVVRWTADGRIRYRLHEHHLPGTVEYESFFRTLPPATKANVWWPHYSLRPSLIRMSAIRETGRYDPECGNFELDFAQRFAQAGRRSAFLDAIHCLHLGKLTWETGGAGQANAYALNDEVQFSAAPRSPGERPFRVKLLPGWTTPAALCAQWQRMGTVGGRWRDIEITADDHDIDYWAIINHPANAPATFDKSRTIVVHMEPSRAVRSWGQWATPDPREFLQVRNHERYRNVAEWHLGLSYSELIAQRIEKSLPLSCVTSGKIQDPGQTLRIAFLKHVEAAGMAIDIWGADNIHHFDNYRGALPPFEKDRGILPYACTIAVENCAEVNYFTEKIVDAILGECLCFYWGCPNLDEYIDPAAYIRLPLDDFELSLHIIEAALGSDERTRRLPAILREKRRILDEYQIFPTLARVVHGHRFVESLRVTVLNLDRRGDRLDAFRRHLDAAAGPAFGVRCERVAAVDGTTLELTASIRHLFRDNDFAFRRGIVGCALSHIGIWRETVARARGAALIFEDDAQPCSGFYGQLVELCGELAEHHPD